MVLYRGYPFERSSIARLYDLFSSSGCTVTTDVGVVRRAASASSACLAVEERLVVRVRLEQRFDGFAHVAAPLDQAQVLPIRHQPMQQLLERRAR